MDFPLLRSKKEFIISIKEKDEILLRSNHLNKRQHQLWGKKWFVGKGASTASGSGRMIDELALPSLL